MARVGVFLAGAFCALSLVGCAGAQLFLDVGAAHSFETGEYFEIDETGPVGYYGFGLEFENPRWYFPDECSFYHRSQLDKHPELSSDDVGCKKRIYLLTR